MKKVVFEGVINGEKFDNVADYNERMSKLIAEGKDVQASSSSHIVEHDGKLEEEIIDDEDDLTTEETGIDEEDQKLEKECKAACERYIDILDDILAPFFGGDGPHYLDELVSGDEDLDKKTLDKVKGDFDSAKNTLNQVLDIENFNLDDALRAMAKYKNIRDGILEDSYCNETAIRDLESEIKRDEERLNTLKSSKPFLKTFLAGYTDLFNAIRNYLLS